MAFVKFEENRFRIDGGIAENHAILVNLTASIVVLSVEWVNACEVAHTNHQLYLIDCLILRRS